MTGKHTGTAAYLRFIEFAHSRRGGLSALSPEEERLFNFLALANYRAERLSVRSVMALRQLGAPATIHTRLKALRAAGWIMLADTEDPRRKHVALTKAAVGELRRLSRCVVEAASA